ncbi:DsbA family oxidoreductase [Streptacidiphilus anmyonensis]|uniref:DsbA family oxidoreductase n=1 Tax=Streptacidiphilus anmyonensis TaxID=405782 RepID=UPI0005AB67DE|nr:DsbA family oxidoreductase [Streptacidiphilus anmyonensis]
MEQRTDARQVVRAEIVLDLICAPSYIGFTRLSRAVARLREEGVDVQLGVLPFQLAPGAPTTGSPLLPVLKHAFGDHAVVQALDMAERAVADGLRFDYENAVATGTFDAHRLVLLAARQGLAEPMTERLFRAHFTDGLHIGDPEVLAGLAAEVGVRVDPAEEASSAEELKERLAYVRDHGVTGVPVFVVDGVPPLTGAQAEDTLYRTLRSAATTA